MKYEYPGDASHRSLVPGRTQDQTELAVRAEEAGVDSIWVAEGPVTRDAFITLSALALATNRVDLATGVVNPFTRHPAQLAATFTTLDEL